MPYIRFAEKDETAGFAYLIIRTPMECFRGSIFKVPPIALDKLKEQGFDFEVVPPPSRDGSQPAAKGATP